MDWLSVITPGLVEQAAWLTLVATAPMAAISKLRWLRWRWREWRIERALAHSVTADRVADLRWNHGEEPEDDHGATWLVRRVPLVFGGFVALLLAFPQAAGGDIGLAIYEELGLDTQTVFTFVGLLLIGTGFYANHEARQHGEEGEAEPLPQRYSDIDPLKVAPGTPYMGMGLAVLALVALFTLIA